MSENMANDAEKLVGLITNGIKNVGSKIINNGDKKSDDKSDTKTDNKKE